MYTHNMEAATLNIDGLGKSLSPYRFRNQFRKVEIKIVVVEVSFAVKLNLTSQLHSKTT